MSETIMIDPQYETQPFTKRGPLTRRKRLSLAGWHLRCALTHLWRIVRG